ncbi:MAG: hypothetical protein J5599_03560 [Spirochaetales bacterium]|nr:hypothetical protein [Spirochaetales bacterium]
MTQSVKSFNDAVTGFASATFSIFMTILLVSFCHLQMTVGIVVSAILALVFAVITLRNFTRILISKEKIEFRPILGKTRTYSWEEIKEVGVIGTKVFPKTSSNKGGRKYIYFSPEELDEDSRFDLAFKWPPKIPFTSYSKAKLDAVQLIWRKPLANYNAPDLIR